MEALAPKENSALVRERRAVGAVNPMPPSPAMTIALEEYKALRVEIAGRSSSQHTLIGLNFTTIGAVCGLVLSGKISPFLFLLMPLICSTIGLLFYDHHWNILACGRYIKRRLWEQLKALAGAPDLRCYEDELSRYGRGALRQVLFGIPFFMSFSAPSIAALALVHPLFTGSLPLGANQITGIWATGVALTAATTVDWLAFVTNGFGRLR